LQTTADTAKGDTATPAVVEEEEEIEVVLDVLGLFEVFFFLSCCFLPVERVDAALVVLCLAPLTGLLRLVGTTVSVEVEAEDCDP